MHVDVKAIEAMTTEELKSYLVEYTIEVERLTTEKHVIDRDRDTYAWAVRRIGMELAAREGACIRSAP